MSTVEEMERDALEPRGVLALHGWHGRVEVSVRVLYATPTKYRVRLLADALLPGGRRRKNGDVVLVPRTAVRLDDERARGAQGGTDGE